MLQNITVPATAQSSLVKNVTVKFKAPFDEIGIAVVFGTFIPMAVFGIIANVITLVVIYKAPNLRSIFNYFIMSLCASDLISATLTLLLAYQRTWGFVNWTIPKFLCKIIVCFIWIFAIAFGLVPYSFFVGVREKYHNSNNINKGWGECTIYEEKLLPFSIYTKYTNVFLYYTPLALVFISSVATSLVILVRRSKRRKARKKRPNRNGIDEAEQNRNIKENQAILQLLLIVGSYAIGYLPIAVFSYLLSEMVASPTTLWWVTTFVFIFLRFSECLNPIFYNLASSKLRAETFKWFKDVFGCKKTLPPPNQAAVTTKRGQANQ